MKYSNCIVIGLFTCARIVGACIYSFSVSFRVRNLKFARNLIFATSKTLVNFMKKMIFCLKFGIFQFKKPKFTVYLTNLTSISLFY